MNPLLFAIQTINTTLLNKKKKTHLFTLRPRAINRPKLVCSQCMLAFAAFALLLLTASVRSRRVNQRVNQRVQVESISRDQSHFSKGTYLLGPVVGGRGAQSRLSSLNRACPIWSFFSSRVESCFLLRDLKVAIVMRWIASLKKKQKKRSRSYHENLVSEMFIVLMKVGGFSGIGRHFPPVGYRCENPSLSFDF